MGVMSSVSVNEQILRNLQWHSFLHFFNFVLLLVLTAMVLTVGVRISNSDSLADAQVTASNVRTITSNMIPVSEVTRTAALSNATSNVTLAQATTDAMTGFARADWGSVVGNATIVMEAIANINYSAVTGLFAQAQEPETQAVIRGQIDRAFSSFDFATRGVTNIFTIFRDGVISEDIGYKTSGSKV